MLTNFLDAEALAAADALESRLGNLAENEIKQLFINSLNRISRLERQVAQLETKAFDRDM